MNIPIIYEDAWLLVVDKPAGILVIPSPKKEMRTLTAILNEDWEHKKISYRLHPCHRLDRETSGLIIYAKGKSMQKKIMQEFKKRKVKKIYLAFVDGYPNHNYGRIDYPIENKSAITKYEVLMKAKDFSILKVIPLTGRTNQIRIHLKKIGHPILGETKYAFRRDFKIKVKRLFLHAQALEFLHPITKKMLYLKSPLPLDMHSFLKQQGIRTESLCLH
ncbi:MAG: RluA family pseudouridine synthase [Candidatus Omnitrophica bacterium]|nr:RluA family pseudouridine synthase [Candidatus Omnitrophota bacterium]